MVTARTGRLLRAAVTAAVIVTVVGGLSAGADNCDVPGCTFTGGCRKSTEVMCDFQDDPNKEITLPTSGLPTSIQTIAIFNAKRIEVKKHFLNSYADLEHIVFGNISEVILLQDSLNQTYNPRPLSVTIENVTKLHIKENAIAEWQHPHGEMNIRNVESCYISPSAFSRSATVANVLFENISLLKVSKEAFKANINHLTLNNSSFHTCFYSTFSGRIGTLTLQSLKINILYAKCVEASNWGSLKLISCHLPRIKFNNFQGTVDNVLIETTSVGVVDGGGFNMNVSTLFIRESSFGDLAEDALNVLANKSIILQQNNVTALRANAFRRLRTSQPGKLFNITELTVGRAYNDSFSFLNDNQVNLHGLSFHTCVCYVTRFAQQLVFGSEIPPQDITTEAKLLLLEPFHRSRCFFENSTLSMAEYYRQQCIVEESETAQPESTEQDDGLSSASDGTNGRRSDQVSGNRVSWSYATIAAVIPLIVLIVIAVVIIRRRSRAGRGLLCGKTPPDQVTRTEDDRHVSQTCNGAAEEEDHMYCDATSSGDVEEEDHMYCEVTLPTDQPTDGKVAVLSNSAAGYTKAPCEGPSVMEAEEEPLYEEISSEGCTEMDQAVVGYEPHGSSLVTAANTLDQSDTRVGYPVYAEVVKKKPKTKNMGNTDKASSAGELPLYAQVVKGKSAANNSKKNHEVPTVADVPAVYAQVSKPKCSKTDHPTDGKVAVFSNSAAANSEEALYSEVEAVEDIPLYAEVSANIEDDVKRQTDDGLLDNPLYESRMF